MIDFFLCVVGLIVREWEIAPNLKDFDNSNPRFSRTTGLISSNTVAVEQFLVFEFYV